MVGIFNPCANTPIAAITDFDVFGSRKLNPTMSGGLEWASTSWNGTPARFLTEGDRDTYDPRVIIRYGTPDDVLQILGNGEAQVATYTTSARIFVDGPWTNTEMTIYLFKTNDLKLDQVTMRARSNHEEACSFGGYVAQFRDTTAAEASPPPEKKSAIEVEVLHPHYRRDLDPEAFTGGLPQSAWIGLKQVTQTSLSTGYVTVKGYVNYNIANQAVNDWALTSQYTINGTNLSPDAGWKDEDEASLATCPIGTGDGTAAKMRAEDLSMFLYTNSGLYNWIRLDGPSNCKVKWFTIRELNPLP